MATCNVDTLIAANPCFAALNPHALQVVITQMLCNLSEGDTATCDVDTLLEQGACFYAMPPFILSVLQAQLLCEIISA
jgi:hypothetical protein